jgi:endoglucanase
MGTPGAAAGAESVDVDGAEGGVGACADGAAIPPDPAPAAGAGADAGAGAGAAGAAGAGGDAGASRAGRSESGST